MKVALESAPTQGYAASGILVEAGVADHTDNEAARASMENMNLFMISVGKRVMCRLNCRHADARAVRPYRCCKIKKYAPETRTDLRSDYVYGRLVLANYFLAVADVEAGSGNLVERVGYLHALKVVDSCVDLNGSDGLDSG